MIEAGKETFSFDLPYLPRQDTIQMAEIRFPRRKKSTYRSKKVKIKFYSKRHMIKSMIIRARIQRTDAYEVYDVSEALVSMINKYRGNIKVEIQMKKWLHAKSKNFKRNHDALLVLYSEDSEFMTDVLKTFVNRAREIKDDNSRLRRSAAPKRKKNKWRTRRNKMCTEYDFRVDFDLIDWGRWIVHPKAFNAKVCYGKCAGPSALKQGVNNHALLQILVRIKNPRLAPMPCCGPKKFRPMSMLYIEHNSIVVRHHDDMVVEQCGCM